MSPKWWNQLNTTLFIRKVNLRLPLFLRGVELRETKQVSSALSADKFFVRGDWASVHILKAGALLNSMLFCRNVVRKAHWGELGTESTGYAWSSNCGTAPCCLVIQLGEDVVLILFTGDTGLSLLVQKVELEAHRCWRFESRHLETTFSPDVAGKLFFRGDCKSKKVPWKLNYGQLH